MSKFRFLSKNKLLGGHYIFIEKSDKLNDIKILEKLKFVDYEYLSTANIVDPNLGDESNFYITEYDGWVNIIDNFSYTVMHHLFNTNPSIFKTIHQIFNNQKVLHCFISDVDDTYFYKYSENGSLVRFFSIVPLNNSYSKTKIGSDFGEKRNGEDQANTLPKISDRIFQIAKIYGINIFHEESKIRVYRKKNIQEFQFNEDEY